MDDRKALNRLPPSDAGNLGIYFQEQKDFLFRSGELNTAPATEKPTPFLAARI
jgi:hypothetical protein